MRITRPVAIGGAVVAALAVAGIAAGRGAFRARSAPASLHLAGPTFELRVPRAKGAVVLDGDMDDPGWLAGCARTGAFVAPDGSSAKPYSDARFVWGDGHLYVALYAADEDVRSDDVFHLAFTDGVTVRRFDFDPLGALDAKQPPGVHVSRELDGSPNDPKDDDEEWVIEAAIPFEALGLRGEPGERVALTIRRCDVFHTGQRSCGSWGEGSARGVLVLE